MNVVLAALLTLLASMELAHALRCYTCKRPTDLAKCVSITNCSEEMTACKTTVLSLDTGYPFFGNVSVEKSCSKNCVPSDPDALGERHPDYCCYTDLCNVRAGSEVRITVSTTTIMVTLGLALLWTGLSGLSRPVKAVKEEAGIGGCLA
ncbi:secreted Ly-6/uPAR-related protein 1-like [Anolis sagrei]|uniref:secreted Ly-6/uPAR-related protein 1-like n=1 Tax=Anolis sagrei TaxID=38937 RepID=UPI00352296C8